MNSVVILGSGNVANHLAQAFIDAQEIELIQIYCRDKEKLNHWSKKIDIIDDLTQLKTADVYIISISDDAIKGFSKTLKIKDSLVVHTSGSVSINGLKGDYEKGVFYPLQTFTKSKKVNFKDIPICIETISKNQLIKLEKIASAISNNVFIIDTEQRKKLHLSAVFANNFVNYLYSISNEICDKNNIPFEILHPLILETASKIKSSNPTEIQTGPAKRNDKKTIQKQLKQLNGNQKEIYKLLTKSIIKKYN